MDEKKLIELAINKMEYEKIKKLKDVYDNLKRVVPPKREDYDTEEEYKEHLIQLQLKLLETVRIWKKEIFVVANDEYNEYLTTKQNNETQISKAREQAILTQGEDFRKIKTIAIFSVIVSIISPASIPVVLVVGIPMMLGTFIKDQAYVHNFLEQEDKAIFVSKLQRDYAEFVYNLREDYHRTNKMLDYLEKKAERGEIIVDDLIEGLALTKELIDKSEKELIIEHQKIKSR